MNDNSIVHRYYIIIKEKEKIEKKINPKKRDFACSSLEKLCCEIKKKYKIKKKKSFIEGL